ncbi:hypothetical protein CIPAW_06G141600 [Carya illinoinensis]|uniref:Uncharacterized protein n=1 Tax=Carya illinoinensis TaxID=32201 RepID=A0A8T1QBR0_CARIL|nr:hypothetical protein CIPAW_06G141600 [Carya illinoinensis]
MCYVFASDHHDEAFESSVWGYPQSHSCTCEYLPFLELSSFSCLRARLPPSLLLHMNWKTPCSSSRSECFRCCPFSTKYSLCVFRSNFRLYGTDDEEHQDYGVLIPCCRR